MQIIKNNFLGEAEIKRIRKLLMSRENRNILALLTNRENLVMREFATKFNTTPMELIAYNKHSRISDLRHIYCKLRCENHGLSYAETALEINRHPSTVWFGVKRINDLLSLNDQRIVAMWNRAKHIPGYYL